MLTEYQLHACSKPCLLAAVQLDTPLIRKENKDKTLKKTIFLTIAILFSSLLQGQHLFSKEQQEMQQTVIRMFQALSERDSVALRYYCSPDVTFYEYGRVWNMDTLLRIAIANGQSAGFERTNSFEFINTGSGKTTSWVTYRLHSVITKDAVKTNLQWLETVILVKEQRHWKVRHLHSTLIKRG